jgi:hypothetical protein
MERCFNRGQQQRVLSAIRATRSVAEIPDRAPLIGGRERRHAFGLRGRTTTADPQRDPRDAERRRNHCALARKD